MSAPSQAASAPSYVCSANYYVDGTKGSDSGTGTAALPWKTIGRGVYNRSPGDCVTVKAGVYTETPFLTMTSGSGWSAPSGYFVLRSDTVGGAKIQAPLSVGTYNVVTIKNSYIIIDGFEIDGRVSKGGATGSCIDDEITVSTGPSTYKGINHLKILNNIVHDCGGSGIELAYGDLYQVSGNIAYKNACCNHFQMSGISIFEPTYDPTATNGDDSKLTYRIDVTNNVSYNNFETNYAAPAGSRTDGNGIIFDTFQNNKRSPAGPTYTQPSHLGYNVVYFNGGAGIAIAHSDHVVADHNSTFNDRLDTGNHGTWRAELEADNSNDVTMLNNIAYSSPVTGTVRANNKAYLFEGGAGLTFRDNLSFNGTAGASSLSPTLLAMTLDPSNILGVSPRYTSTSWPGIELTLQSGSPVFGLGVGAY